MDFRGLERLADLVGVDNDAALRERWAATSSWLEAFGLGECTPEEFARGVVDEWGLELTPSEFLRKFASWPAGPFEGTTALLKELHGVIPLACLSDTNPIHWGLHLSRWGLVEFFDWTFVSHELGMLKPNPKVYEHVVGTIGAPAGQLVFLDDTLDNVVAGTRSGMQAHHVRGTDEVRAALLAYEGLLQRRA